MPVDCAVTMNASHIPHRSFHVEVQVTDDLCFPIPARSSCGATVLESAPTVGQRTQYAADTVEYLKRPYANPLIVSNGTTNPEVRHPDRVKPALATEVGLFAEFIAYGWGGFTGGHLEEGRSYEEDGRSADGGQHTGGQR